MQSLAPIVRTALVGALLGVLAAAMTACAAVGAAGERGAQLGAGAGFGFLAWLAHPIGWIGAALAGLAGAVGAMLFAPRPGAPVVVQEGAPLGRLAALGFLVAFIFWPGFRSAVLRALKGLWAKARRGGSPSGRGQSS